MKFRKAVAVMISIGLFFSAISQSYAYQQTMVSETIPAGSYQNNYQSANNSFVSNNTTYIEDTTYVEQNSMVENNTTVNSTTNNTTVNNNTYVVNNSVEQNNTTVIDNTPIYQENQYTETNKIEVDIIVDSRPSWLTTILTIFTLGLFALFCATC